MRRRLVWSGAAAVMAIYAVVLWKLQPVWHSDRTLFTSCIQNFPEAATCHTGLGEALLQAADDRAAAERELTKAISIAPDDPQILYELARTHALLGKVGEATREMARALKFMPRPTVDDFAILAQLYDLNGEPTQSEDVLRYAESLPGGAQVAGVTRAQMKISHGDASGAEVILRGLAARYPGNYRVWTLLGLALAAQNRQADALSAFSRALVIAPPDPAPHFFAAQLLHAMGRDQEALDQCREVLALAPYDQGAKALIAAIERQGMKH